MASESLEKPPSVGLQRLVVILAGFAAVIWIAAGPWSSFIERGLGPIQPLAQKPAPTPEPSPSPTPSPSEANGELGGVVAEGCLAVRGRAVDLHGKPYPDALVTVRVVE